MRILILLLLTSLQAVAQITYPAYATTKHPRNGDGDLIVLNDSTYLIVNSQFYTDADEFSAAQIVGLKSTDRGKTWQSTGVIQPNVGLQTTNSASLLRLNTTDVLLFYLVGNSYTDLKCYVRKSTNNAETFGAPVLVTDTTGYWVMNNARAVRLASGRIICPVSYTPDVLQSFGSAPAVPWKSRIIYSDDNGATWSRSNGWVTAPMRGAMEPGVVELAPSNLLMYIRTQTGKQYYATSADNGINWSSATPSTLISPESPATIIKHGSSLIAIYNHNYDPADTNKYGDRTPLTIAVSADNGATWVRKFDIEDRRTHAFAYTSAIVHGESLILTYWDSINGNSLLSMKFRTIALSDMGL